MQAEEGARPGPPRCSFLLIHTGIASLRPHSSGADHSLCLSFLTQQSARSTPSSDVSTSSRLGPRQVPHQADVLCGWGQGGVSRQ